MERVLILVVDGCAPGYLNEATAPGLYRLAGECGFAKRIQCAMPSVTNVNHACILSGQWPRETGVIGNYFYDPRTGREGFVEERGYMKAPTILQRCRAAGGRTALLTVKGKVLGVYGDGADIGLSAEAPGEETLRRYGLKAPPPIRSVESTEWILQAALRCVERDAPDLVYCTTNDYVFHHCPPGHPHAVAQIRAVEDYVEKIHRADPGRQIYITADHGMNQKTVIVNFQTAAERAGFRLFCLPPLKDRYVENHIYQEGGMLYVFLKDPGRGADFAAFARRHPQVEKVLTAREAAEAYHLPEGQIGDFVLFSAEGCAFGEVEGEVLHTEASRTHGSLYEREIPLIAIHPAAGAEAYAYNKDIAAHLAL